MNPGEYIKVDNNKVINLNYIRWVKKMDECLQICTKSNGCCESDTSKLCKLNNPTSYEKMNRLFE